MPTPLEIEPDSPCRIAVAKGELPTVKSTLPPVKEFNVKLAEPLFVTMPLEFSKSLSLPVNGIGISPIGIPANKAAERGSPPSICAVAALAPIVAAVDAAAPDIPAFATKASAGIPKKLPTIADTITLEAISINPGSLDSKVLISPKLKGS